jgi:uncharacterized membrane protein YdcZ (DUF606 family)
MKRTKVKAVIYFLIGGVCWGIFVAITAPTLPEIKLLLALALSLAAIILISTGIQRLGSESFSEDPSENKGDS